MHKTGIYTVDDLKQRCRIDEAGCWVWAGHLERSKAPRMWSPTEERIVTAGHLIHGLVHGKSYPNGMVYGPMKCLNVTCCNPAHRRLVSKSSYYKAFAKPMDPARKMKLTLIVRQRQGASNEEVRLIRESEEPAKVIAERLGRSDAWVRMVRRGKRRRDQIAPNASVFAMAV